MTNQQLISAEEARKNAFDSVLHRSTGQSQGGVKSMLGKNHQAHAAAVDEYFQHWSKKAEEETEESRQARTDDYASLTRQ